MRAPRPARRCWIRAGPASSRSSSNCRRSRAQRAVTPSYGRSKPRLELLLETLEIVALFRGTIAVARAGADLVEDRAHAPGHAFGIGSGGKLHVLAARPPRP